jgi:hypothetical protein
MQGGYVSLLLTIGIKSAIGARRTRMRIVLFDQHALRRQNVGTGPLFSARASVVVCFPL